MKHDKHTVPLALVELDPVGRPQVVTAAGGSRHLARLGARSARLCVQLLVLTRRGAAADAYLRDLHANMKPERSVLMPADGLDAYLAAIEGDLPERDVPPQVACVAVAFDPRGRVTVVHAPWEDARWRAGIKRAAEEAGVRVRWHERSTFEVTGWHVLVPVEALAAYLRACREGVAPLWPFPAGVRRVQA